MFSLSFRVVEVEAGRKDKTFPADYFLFARAPNQQKLIRNKKIHHVHDIPSIVCSNFLPEKLLKIRNNGKSFVRPLFCLVSAAEIRI